VINGNRGPIFHPFRDTTSYRPNLKLFMKNCGKTAANGDIVTIDSLQKAATGTIADHLRLTV